MGPSIRVHIFILMLCIPNMKSSMDQIYTSSPLKVPFSYTYECLHFPGFQLSALPGTKNKIVIEIQIR